MDVTQRAIKEGGGPTKLGRRLGLSRQAVEQWRLVPPKHVLDVEGITGISRHHLRPDIYGEAPAGAKASSASVAA